MVRIEFSEIRSSGPVMKIVDGQVTQMYESTAHYDVSNGYGPAVRIRRAYRMGRPDQMLTGEVQLFAPDRADFAPVTAVFNSQGEMIGGRVETLNRGIQALYNSDGSLSEVMPPRQWLSTDIPRSFPVLRLRGDLPVTEENFHLLITTVPDKNQTAEPYFSY